MPATLQDHIRQLVGNSAIITEEMVRGRVNDNLSGCGALDPGYTFPTRLIAVAMVSAAADFNALQPNCLNYNPSALPNKGFMMDAVLSHLYQQLLYEEQQLDVNGSSGPVTNDVAARRTQHYIANMSRLTQSFIASATQWKQQYNRDTGWAQIG